MKPDMAQVTIIGAGPAGLALAWHLSRLNIRYRLLERGKTGNSWLNMADSLHLVSPDWVNTLPGTRVSLRNAYKKMSASEFSRYLNAYRQEHAIEVQEETEVHNVLREPEGFVIRTGKGEYYSPIVVSAGGYYGNPFYPESQTASDGSIPTLHACDFVNAGQLKKIAGEKPRVLIVGKRVTAGQLMVELSDAGMPVTLSASSPVDVRASTLRARAKEVIYFIYEDLLIRLFPHTRANSYPAMDGGRSEQLLQSGAVQVRPRIEAIKAGAAHFADSTSAPFDLILYATGYRPHMPYLRELLGMNDETYFPQIDGMQSKQVKGLYFLGLDNLRNYRSRYLRGIKADAGVLAREIQRALGSTST